MRLDNIQKPCTFWYEDHDENKIPYEQTDAYNLTKKGWKSQHMLYPIIREEICLANGKKDRLPVKILEWLLRKMPRSWKSTTTISHYHYAGIYEIIKYLVEQRVFSFREATVAASKMCDRCEDLCMSDLGNAQCRTPYYDICEYCDMIDPGYTDMRRVQACYSTMKHNGDISKAFNNCRMNGAYIKA